MVFPYLKGLIIIHEIFHIVLLYLLWFFCIESLVLNIHIGMIGPMIDSEPYTNMRMNRGIFVLQIKPYREIQEGPCTSIYLHVLIKF
jgi:hypothetical protein